MTSDLTIDYAYYLSELKMGKPIYQQVLEFIVEYVRVNGGAKGAFKEAAKKFYPKKYAREPRKAVKLVYEHYRYARKRLWNKRFGTFWNKEFGTSGTSFGQDRIDETIEYNMGYYIDSHSGPIHESKFTKDSKNNRKLFELKKLVYATLQDMIKPKSTLTSYVEEVFRDPRLVNVISKLDENIWYNGPSYVKLPRKAAALLYMIVYKIYTKHYGVGNKPERLIKRFFEVTGYGPRDLEKELRELSSIFYDWLLFLG